MKALVLIGGPVALVPVLAISVSGGAGPADGGPRESTTIAVREALTHPGYRFLTAGFFVCGFHVAFVSTHLPPCLIGLDLGAALAAWALALMGLFNVVGAYTAGVLGGRCSRRLLLTGIYASRGATFALFGALPATPATVVVFAAAIGLLWLSTVPLTSGLIAVMFGTRHLGLLFGVVFLSHQVGAFVGVWLGGGVYDATGASGLMWWVSIVLGLAAAVHLPIGERPAPRPAASPA